MDEIHVPNNEWLENFKTSQMTLKPTTVTLPGEVELFDLEDPRRTEYYGILNDANLFIRLIEADKELFDWVKAHPMEHFGEAALEAAMPKELWERIWVMSFKADTDGRSGSSFMFVWANAMWRIWGFVDTVGRPVVKAE